MEIWQPFCYLRYCKGNAGTQPDAKVNHSDYGSNGTFYNKNPVFEDCHLHCTGFLIFILMSRGAIIGCLFLLAGFLLFLSLDFSRDSTPVRWLGYSFSSTDNFLINVRQSYRAGLALGFLLSGVVVLVFLWGEKPKRDSV